MIFRKVSQLSGIEREMDLPVTQAEVNRWEASGEFVQDAFPHLDAGQREFLLTGITPDEWARMVAS